jgi:hypothetical protein
MVHASSLFSGTAVNCSPNGVQIELKREARLPILPRNQVSQACARLDHLRRPYPRSRQYKVQRTNAASMAKPGPNANTT